MKRLPDERGSESVELAILLPVALLVIAMLVVGARIALSGGRISGVAGIAARDASLTRTAADAQQTATTSATDALAEEGITCTDLKVQVDTSGYSEAPGTPAVVSVDVWCTVSLADIGIAGLPGSRTLHDRATSPLDPARAVP